MSINWLNGKQEGDRSPMQSGKEVEMSETEGRRKGINIEEKHIFK